MKMGYTYYAVEQILLDMVVQPWHLLLGMFVFMLIIASVILFILFYLVRRGRHTAIRLQLREQYSEVISELAVCETEVELDLFIQMPSTKQVLFRLLEDGFARKVMITELLKTAKSMTGSAAKNVYWFYAQTELDKDSLHRLKYGEWHEKARAIQELSGLRQHKQITRIYRLTNHSDELVRNEARTAVVKLTGFEGLRFLDVISYPLTAWQQLCLLHELSFHKAESFEQIDRWLHSTNDSVVEFALRLIEIYKLHDLQPKVIDALSHQSIIVRKKAIDALQEIYQPDAAAYLIRLFQFEKIELQLLILKLFEVHAGVDELPFLLECLSHQATDIKVAAAKALNQTQINGLGYIEQRVVSTEYPWAVLLPQLKKEGSA
jgi:hypothetical protein